VKKKSLGEIVWILALPTFFCMTIARSSVKAWFGLADDHLHFEAQNNASGNFYENLNFYFGLQPWGQTTRFNPSQLIGWTMESTIFGVNPLGWRVMQLIAVVICGTAVGIATKNICKYLNVSSNKSKFYYVFAQAIFLALPFWSETIGRIGAPETFGAVALSLILVSISRILIYPDSIVNFVFLAMSTILLVGFKENLLMIGFSSIILQLHFIRKNQYSNRLKFIFLIFLQLAMISLIIYGFLPELVSSGQQVNGAGIGFGRLVMSKWLVVPALSFGVLIFSHLFSWPKYRPQILKINLGLTTLVFCEYFIMAGRLGGHYGFLSAVLLSVQTVATIVALEKLRKLSIVVVSALTITGLVFNLVNTNAYFERTSIFKQELLRLKEVQQNKDLRNVVITASSEEHYEAVSSIVSFNREPGIRYFLVVTDDFPEGQLRNNLVKFSFDGDLDWHISPIDEWTSNLNCVAIGFSLREELEQCVEEIRISWIGD
jgi:hypothetical protein